MQKCLCLALTLWSCAALRAWAQDGPADGGAPPPVIEPDPRSWLAPPPAAPPPEYSARATATRTEAPKTDLPASVTEIDRTVVDLHPGQTSDAVLRTVPSAATFRRSSSMVADPSAQGLNLRGVAPSGVSRTLVLLDGVPENDPFGGWVYWRALPRLDIDRIEIVPGGGSALYGSAALGGVVQMFSRGPSQPGFDADFSYGNLDTLTLGGRVATQFGAFGVALSGEWLRSDGYTIVAPDQRGPIDGKTPSENGNLNGRFTLELAPVRLWANLGWFREVQNGGTQYTSAEVTLGRASAGAIWDAKSAGKFELLLFGRRERFGQVRARIDEGRTSEELASEQEVPAGDEGGSLAWTAPQFTGFGKHSVLVGVDARHVSGESTDDINPAQPMDESVVVKSTGGQQWTIGGFVQDFVQASKVFALQVNLRADTWRSYAAERELTRMNGEMTQAALPAQSASTFSPRLGVSLQATRWLQLKAAGYRAFRAPTLNELYRSFQVGTILTAANDQLGPEHVLGGELGAVFTEGSWFDARLTGFLNVLQNPISNVTLSEPLPDGSTRQRQNLGSAQVYGFELDTRWRFGRHTRLTFAYTFAHSEVTDAGEMQALEGKQLAQDPEHRATFGAIVDVPGWVTALLQLRVLGPQYEDDLNTLSMHGYVLLDATLTRRLVGGWEAFAAGENLLGTDYLVGRAGVDTMGAPFTFRFGIRIRAPRPPAKR